MISWTPLEAGRWRVLTAATNAANTSVPGHPKQRIIITITDVAVGGLE